MKLSSRLISTLSALAVCGAAWAQTATTGFVTLEDSSGAPVRAYVAGPDGAKSGILIVHDYFGISDFTTRSAQRLAAHGYRVVAVDLYRGRSASNDEAAARLMKEMQGQDRAITDRTLQAGLDALKRPDRRIGTLGFSMGGIEALNAGLNDTRGVQATAIVYGFGFGQLDAKRLAALQGPVLTVTGALDQGSLQATVELMQRGADLPRPLEMLVMPQVGHAYAQPLFGGGKGYSAVATEATWRAIDEFFASTLKPAL